MVVRLDGGASQGERVRVRRNDTYRLDKIERLSNGALRVDAVVTKSGVFTYYDEAGNEIREYRPPSEVEKADSVASLRDMPVTFLHPPGLVTPENWDMYAIGHVSSNPSPSQAGIKTPLVVHSADGIKAIEKEEAVECSCGYELWLEDTSGVTPQGEKFDRIQRDITYNHVALGPPGWGRQGASVSLRLDNAGNQISERGERTMKITIVFDGQTYTVDAGSKEHTDLLNKIAARQAEYDGLVKTNKELKSALDAKNGECDALKKETGELKTKLDAAPALAREQAAARLKLEASATEVLGDSFKCDGKDDTALRVEIIKKFDPDFKFDSKEHSADYVRAMSDTYLKRGTGDLQTRMALEVADPPVNARKDSSRQEYVPDENDPDVEGARRKMHRDNANAHKGFAVTK
jgi:hypothetical protein